MPIDLYNSGYKIMHLSFYFFVGKKTDKWFPKFLADNIWQWFVYSDLSYSKTNSGSQGLIFLKIPTAFYLCLHTSSFLIGYQVVQAN